jgi:hypothetical protein
VAGNANSYLVDLATILSDSADRQQYWPAYDLDSLSATAAANASARPGDWGERRQFLVQC